MHYVIVNIGFSASDKFKQTKVSHTLYIELWETFVFVF